MSRRVVSRLAASVVLAAAAAACGSPAPSDAPPSPGRTAMARPSEPSAPSASVAGPGASVAGKVAETMNSGGYTYARLVEQGVESWIAASEFPVAVGDTVTATVSLPMKQFHSRTLDRDFALIHFVGQVSKNGEIVVPGQAGINDAPAATGSRPAESASPGGSPVPLVEKVSTPPGGMSIADVWAKRATASGQTVVVRGRVVKANYDILGANWYHLQDGSGVVAAGTHDLTVTSPARAAIGDIVIATGVLATSKDFGGGYTYDVVVEDARLTK